MLFTLNNVILHFLHKKIMALIICSHPLTLYFRARGEASGSLESSADGITTTDTLKATGTREQPV